MHGSHIDGRRVSSATEYSLVFTDPVNFEVEKGTKESQRPASQRRCLELRFN